jgi:CheY-like chemotaxis protein
VRTAGERILIVDDNPQNLKLARVLLATEGYEVEPAMDAEAAMNVIEWFEPRVILMDLQLPGMDGLELTRQLKADPRRRSIGDHCTRRLRDERGRAEGADRRLRRIRVETDRHRPPAEGRRRSHRPRLEVRRAGSRRRPRSSSLKAIPPARVSHVTGSDRAPLLTVLRVPGSRP